MILLCAITATLACVTGSALNVSMSASWVDADGNTITPGSVNELVSTATSTTIVPSPAASTQRNVKFVAIRNTDASTNQATVQHFDGTTTAVLISVPLQSGYTLFYEDGQGWYVSDENGNRQGVQGEPGTPGTNGTNGTNAGNTGTATVDFGAFPGTDITSAVVTGQTTILSTSTIEAYLMTDTSSSYTPLDHQYAASLISFACGTIVPGVGFTINATCISGGMQGAFSVRWIWT